MGFVYHTRAPVDHGHKKVGGAGGPGFRLVRIRAPFPIGISFFRDVLLSGQKLLYFHPLYGPLAQLVEQLTLNQVVPGSSPGRPTKNLKKSAELHQSPFFFPTPVTSFGGINGKTGAMATIVYRLGRSCRGSGGQKPSASVGDGRRMPFNKQGPCRGLGTASRKDSAPRVATPRSRIRRRRAGPPFRRADLWR